MLTKVRGTQNIWRFLISSANIGYWGQYLTELIREIYVYRDINIFTQPSLAVPAIVIETSSTVNTFTLNTF